MWIVNHHLTALNSLQKHLTALNSLQKHLTALNSLQLPVSMPCTVCYEATHNKRTCPFQLKAPIGVDLSLVPAVTEVEYAAPISSKRVCSACGECGHNKRTCSAEPKSPPKNVANTKQCSECGECGHNKRTCLLKTPPKSGRKCSECGEFGHNKRTCLLMVPVKQKKCSVCDELGHNSRTCNLKCQPCADQVARSYCFAGFTAEKAVKIAKILECASIYGETEEYPQFVESPPVQRKTENITFANGESLALDLGPVA